MDRKAIAAIGISLLVLLLYPYYLQKFYPQKSVLAKHAAQQVETPSGEIKKTEDVKPSDKIASGVKEEEFFIQTDLYNVVLSNIGGTIKRIELKKYKNKDKKEVDIAQDELASIRPLSIITAGTGKDLSVAAFEGRIEDKKIIFEYTGEDKISVKKIFYFNEKSYEIKVKNIYKNLGDKEIDVSNPEIVCGSIFPVDPKAGVGELGIAGLMTNDTVERIKVGKIKEETTFKGPFSWAGMQNQFYAIIARPSSKIEAIKVKPLHVEKGRAKGFQLSVRTGSLKLAQGAVHEEDFLFYMGPKEYRILKEAPYGFVKIFDFGIFGFISVAILISLNFLFRIFRNYGIAIIIITVVIKILLYPFTAKSLKSMKQMQVIQPLITEIREKYKDNPKKMQKEMMVVYKEYKVNPMSGCLPMLAQLPIFIALFNTLKNAIELKGAKFLWVADLSMPDTIFSLGSIPVNVLPLIMGVTMIWQQKLTPTDPSQAKMMMIMPVIFTFMFYSFPAGLVLYWLVNNILSIIQQYQVQAKQ